VNTEEHSPSIQTDDVRVRPAEDGDVSQVVALDALVTGVAKAEYWRDLHERYRERRAGEGFFFIAEGAGGESPEVLGYVIGEVRAWEFGSAPCGWVFALSVQPETRQRGVGEHLLNAISDAFRSVGVGTMRTMISRDNHLLLSFFRSEGLMAGPYIQLEKDLS
jgi:ribosomal protein S18 acetylase RimI-like enzyme